MDIKLDAESLKTVIAKAVLDNLGEVQREAIMRGAIEHLLTPPVPSGAYGQRQDPTPIQSAFNQAVRDVALQVARETVAGDTVIREKIRGLLVAAAEKALDGDGKIVEKLSSALTKALTGSEY